MRSAALPLAKWASSFSWHSYIIIVIMERVWERLQYNYDSIKPIISHFSSRQLVLLHEFSREERKKWVSFSALFKLRDTLSLIYIYILKPHYRWGISHKSFYRVVISFGIFQTFSKFLRPFPDFLTYGYLADLFFKLRLTTVREKQNRRRKSQLITWTLSILTHAISILVI